MSRFALLFTEQDASCSLPDKEFRSDLLLASLEADLDRQTSPAGRSFLPTSTCRHAARTISSPRLTVESGV